MLSTDIDDRPASTRDVPGHIDITGIPPASRETRRFRAGLGVIARAMYGNRILSKEKTKAREVKLNSLARRRKMNLRSGRALMINGRLGWTARRSRREQDHTMLLTAAFKSDNAGRGAMAVYKSAHNHDRNENTSAARIPRGRRLNSPNSSQPINCRTNWSKPNIHDIWILEVTGTDFPSSVLWMNGILGVFEWV